MTTTSGSDAPSGAVVGAGWMTRDDLVRVARTVTADQDAGVGDWSVEPVDYAFGSPTTDGLFRVRTSVLTRGQEVAVSAFVKVIRSYRHWPLIHVVPQGMREQALAGQHWRYEAEVYSGGVRACLPPGLRLPHVHLVQDLGDERFALVLEDVVTDQRTWSPALFARAAEVLGRLAVRLTRADALPRTASRVAGETTRRWHAGRVEPVVLPALDDEATWAHPLLRPHHALRRDALEVARRLPGTLRALDRLPQVMAHGDASPQNLLVPVAEPDTLVAVDWTLSGLVAVGDDLGQLLVGLAHAGRMQVSELPGLRDVLVTSYAKGLALEGMPVEETEVRAGLDAGLAVRSALTSLPLERLGEPLSDELAHLFHERLELTRYLVDLALELPLVGDLVSSDRFEPSVGPR